MKSILFVVSSVLLGSVLADGDVLVFTDANFADEVAKHQTILVEFYAPWCGHCKRLAPEYEQAATALKGSDPPVPLAKVDCTVETNTCSKFGVSGYPTLKIFKSGAFSKDYDGPREAKGIISKMKKEAGPTSVSLSSVEKAKKFLSKESVRIIGFFESEDDALAKNFMKVADQTSDANFAHTTDESVKKELKQSEDGIVLYRPSNLQSRFEDSEVPCKEKSVDKIKKFIQSESLGLCAERTMNNAENFEKPLFVAYYDVDYKKNPKGTNYWRNRVMKVGKKIRDEGESVFFGVSGREEMSREIEECGLETSSDNKPVVCAWDSKNKKYKMDEDFSVENFEQFVRNVLANKVEAYVKSEPIPESNDEPVKVVVGKNFDEIVNDKTKDVLIEFYAPWCGHCKSLAPKYDELAEKLKDEESIVIAKMDATANDVPGPYEVRGFPTIYFAPKNSKDAPKKYEGGREVDDFIKYLSEESTDGISIKKEKKKKKKTEL